MLEISNDNTTCNQEGVLLVYLLCSLLGMVLAFRLDLDITHHAATRNKTLFSAVKGRLGYIVGSYSTWRALGEIKSVCRWCLKLPSCTRLL